jgi:hypothetical protein
MKSGTMTHICLGCTGEHIAIVAARAKLAPPHAGMAGHTGSNRLTNFGLEMSFAPIIGCQHPITVSNATGGGIDTI